MKRSNEGLVVPKAPIKTELTKGIEENTPARLAGIIKSARNIMRKDKGLNGDLDRLPQLTWLMFLKFLDDVETIRETAGTVAGKSYSPLIEPPYRWRDWASNPGGMTGDELTAFVNNDESMRPDGKRGPGLLAYLRSLQSKEGSEARTVISNVFRGVSNRMLLGYLLRDVVNKINGINFSSSKEIHSLSYLYESLLRELRDAAGDSGEFYTPRPVVRFIVNMSDPRLGETILDPAAGTGGFLVETFLHLQGQCKTAEDAERLQNQTLFGVEAKSLPYLLCQMNLLLHGVESPSIDPLNALRYPLGDIGDSERVDVILTNPPFGGEEEKGILSNFPEDKQTNETALLFLQLMMRKLRRPKDGRRGGRCAVVLPNGNTLSGSGVSERVRRELLTEFNLHTIIRLPMGVFAPYTTIQANILFFEKDEPTKEIWYFELPLPEGRNQYTKTKPLQYEEFRSVSEWWMARAPGRQAWKISAESVLSQGCDLDIKNPSTTEASKPLSPDELLKELLQKQERAIQVIHDLSKALEE